MDERTARRFWAKVDRRGPDECWEWTGAKRDRGYGAFHIGQGRPTGKAHRVAWELTHGPIPEGDGYHGTCVCHTCDNPGCVNPAHLFLGTQADNLADCAAKGRAPLARLSLDEIREMRRLMAGGASDREVAETFGVPRRNVNNIRRRRTWAGADPEGQE